MSDTQEVDDQHRRLIAAAEAIAVDEEAARFFAAFLNCDGMRGSRAGEWLRATVAGRHGMEDRFPLYEWDDSDAVIALRMAGILHGHSRSLPDGLTRMLIVDLAREWSISVEADAAARLDSRKPRFRRR